MSKQLATPPRHPLDLGPRVVVLQRQYAENGEVLTVLRAQVVDLDWQLNRPLPDFLTEAGVRY